MIASATLKKALCSPQKARLVADQIRGASVEKALEVLTFSPKKISYEMRKLLESAVANAENKEAVDVDELKVKEIYVNQAQFLKRIRPRAKGRANRITKRTCHITVSVTDE